MKSKSCLLVILCSLLLGSGVQLAAKELESSINREEDLRVILNQTTLKEEQFEKIVPLYVAQKIDQNGYPFPMETIISRLRKEMQSKEVLKQLMQPYETFSDEEIHQLREIFESEVFVKYGAQSFLIFKSNMQVMDQMLNLILQQGFEVPAVVTHQSMEKVEEKTSIPDSEILVITKDNFHEEVEESEKPIILDVYADWCSPCQHFSQTFETLHEKYKEQCRFGKVNADEESMLVTFLKVKKYPTTVFIYKGKVTSREIGNMPQKKFEGKIKDFLKEIEKDKSE